MTAKTPKRAASKSGYEGLQGDVRTLKLPRLDTWDNEYPDRDYEIVFHIQEFTCVCPKTGLPDFATFTIRYVPDVKCVELKSLKLYLTAFRDVGIFHEHVTNRLLDDLVKKLRPRRLCIVGRFFTRGGIHTDVVASYPSLDDYPPRSIDLAGPPQGMR